MQHKSGNGRKLNERLAEWDEQSLSEKRRLTYEAMAEIHNEEVKRLTPAVVAPAVPAPEIAISLDEAARRHNVCRRTIERRIAELEEDGVHVVQKIGERTTVPVDRLPLLAKDRPIRRTETIAEEAARLLARPPRRKG